MNSQICVHCQNKKPINLTDNRLVTESCGHVKCMDCLLHEKSGCVACIKDKNTQQYGDVLTSDELTVESEREQIDIPATYDEPNKQEIEYYNDINKKKKPETSHIRIETDTNGRCYVCIPCKKRFHARSQVAYHAYCNGQRKPYQCPECSKSFATHSHFKYHMRVHRNERTYACDVCGDSFFQMSKLQRHKLKHTKEKKYVCSQCNKAFNNLTSLRKHGLTHTEERPYKCDTCGRRFRDGSNYKKHVAKHDEKKCTCGVCGRAARRTHQCPRCPQAFHSGKDMRRHAAVHTDSKPFRCKVCNRRFRRKDNLERHIRNTHPDYVPATAVECDESALKEISSANGQTNGEDLAYQSNEKTMLEKRNPLPPLPQEVIQKHMQPEINETVSVTQETKIDKSYILEANNARQSVIFGPVKRVADIDREPTHQVCEYVHKIRKANSMVSQKDVPLPPIDEKKIIELVDQKTDLNGDIAVPPKNVELYKKILYEKPEKDSGLASEEDGYKNTSPGVHWRRKMKLNIN